MPAISIPEFVKTMSFTDKVQIMKDHVPLCEHGRLGDTVLRRCTRDYLDAIGFTDELYPSTWLHDVANEVTKQFAEHFLAAVGVEEFEHPDATIEDGYYYFRNGDSMWRLSNEDLDRDISFHVENKGLEPFPEDDPKSARLKNLWVRDRLWNIKGWEPVTIVTSPTPQLGSEMIYPKKLAY